MVSKEQEQRWRDIANRKKEIKKQIIDFIILMMEEYNISEWDLK